MCKRLVVLYIFWLPLLCFAEDCYSEFSGKYRVCISDDKDVSITEKGNNHSYSLKGDKWLDCQRHDDCKKLMDESKKLYFETSLVVFLSSKATRAGYKSGLIENNCNREIKDNKNINKEARITRFIDLENVLQQRIDTVKSERSYHLGHYKNLEKIIIDYNSNYSIISDKKFNKSYDYNKYKEPLDYLVDLARYRRELMHAKNELDWLAQISDISDFNIALNLEKNKIIKSLFDQFKEQSGFPDNLDKIKEVYLKKISEIKQEEDLIYTWIMGLERERLRKFEEQIPIDLKFDRLSQGQAIELSGEYLSRVAKLIEDGNIEGAKEKIDEFEDTALNMESLLSLQVNSASRKDTLNKISANNRETVKDLRSLLYSKSKSIPTQRLYFKENRSRVYATDKSSDENFEDVDSEVEVDHQHEVEFFTVTLEDTDTGKFHTRRMTSEMLNYLKEQGSVYGIDPVRNKILLRDGNSLVSISLIPLQKAAGIIRDTFSELHVEEELVKVTENYFKNIEERKDLFSLTERGRSVLTLSRTLNNEMKYSVTVKDEAFERINIQMERVTRIASSPIHFSTDPTPVTDDDVDLDLGTAAKYTLYFGISFTPGLGNITNIADLVSMLLTQKDLLGNNANDVDFVLAGLGILLPPLKNSPKLLKVVKSLMSYIKKAGPKALAVLGKLKGQGKEAFRQVFEGIEAFSEFGVNAFADVSSEMWKHGRRILSAGKKVGYRTKEKVLSLINFMDQVVINRENSLQTFLVKLSSNNIASNASSRNKLFKQLASEAQTKEVGVIIAGGGSHTLFRNAGDAARRYGGQAKDYAKKASSSVITPDGLRIETHWVENMKTGERFEFKTILSHVL